MKLIPQGNAVVVEPESAERVTPGGIVIPETDAKRRDIAATIGTVVELGNLSFEAEMKHEKEFGSLRHRMPSVGDVVLYGKFAGFDIERKGKKYRVLWDDDIAAILEDEDE